MGLMWPPKMNIINFKVTVVLCFLCTDMHIKFFHNFHLDPNAHNF